MSRYARKTEAPTAEQFLRDVAEHRMTVVRDDGVYRHVSFAKPGTGNLAFTLTTWPGYLAISGDAGTYVFTRLRDMFEFFRRESKPLDSISWSYWAEKCESYDRSCGITEYDPDLFREAVRSYIETDEDDDPMDADLVEAIENQVLSRADEGRTIATAAAHEFCHGGFALDDFWEHCIDRYTWRFLWCCMAIAWGVQQYDAAKANQKGGAA